MKRHLKGAEEYSAIFEVNICLRIPFEKNYHRNSYLENTLEFLMSPDDYISKSSSESLKKKLEYNDLKNVLRCDSKSPHEELSESIITQASYTSSSQGKRGNMG